MNPPWYDKKVDLTINGKEVETAEKQKPKFNADGIALSPDNDSISTIRRC